MAVDFATFLDCVFHIVENKNPVLLRGRHGVGKSEIVSQISEQLNLELVQRRASQMTEGDLLGLPSTDGQTTRWNPPDWFKKACEEAVTLFLDEVDRGCLEVRQGIFELTDSRQLAGHRLHEGTVIFAAINGGEDGALYSVGDMDPAELDRYTVFDVAPTVEDWLSWASKNCHEYVVEFIRENPSHLEHSGDFESGKVYPSRRSWKRFSDCASKILFDALLDEQKASAASATIFNLANAYLGLEAAIAFGDFLKEGVQITVEDFLNGKLTENKIKKASLNQHHALLDRLEQQKTFKKKFTKKQIGYLADYLYHLPSELCVKLYTLVGLGHTENLLNLNSGVLVNDEDISHYIVGIITGDTIQKEDPEETP